MGQSPGEWRLVTPAGDGRPEIRVADQKDALSYSAARFLVALLAEAIETRGRASIALSGGSTPRGTYDLLAGSAGRALRWGTIDMCFGDERVVPPDHPDSTYAMVRDALFPHGHEWHDAPRLHRIRGELAADAAAADYERTLRAIFPDAAADPSLPILDIALLGVGDDGHTASLFPGDPVLGVRDRWVARSTAPPAFPVRDRVTLTLPALERSRVVCFLCAGLGKREIVRRVLVDGADLPAALVKGRERTVWLLDRGAAMGL